MDDIHGEPGWTGSGDIARILAPYADDLEDDFAVFSQLPGSRLRELAHLMPLSGVTARHNNAPSIAAFTFVAAASADVTFDGYVVGVPREDERIMVTDIHMDGELGEIPWDPDTVQDVFGSEPDDISEAGGVVTLHWD